MSNQEPRPEIKAYSKGELRALYSISYYTLRKWLLPFQKEIGECIGGRYKPNQVEIIFQRLGYPS